MDEVKVIIAGSRTIKQYSTVRDAVIQSGLWDQYKRRIVVVSGKAKGVDTLGEVFAEKAGLRVIGKPADWDNIKAEGAVVRKRYDGKKYNALAGHWRNQEMADDSDIALVIWDGKSTGSLDMLERMMALGKRAILYALRIDADLLAKLEKEGKCEIIFPSYLTATTVVP